MKKILFILFTFIILFSCTHSPTEPKTQTREAIISFDLDQTSDVTIKIQNSNMETIRTLTNDDSNPGQHMITWNGEDSQGNSVASGIYYYSLFTDDYFNKKSMLILR